MPEEIKGYHPLWINRDFLRKAEYNNGRLSVGDASFSWLYLDVVYLDERALDRVIALAQAGLPVIIKKPPQQPGKSKSADYEQKLADLKNMANVSENLNELVKHQPLISGELLPDYWSRVESDGTQYIFLAQPLAKDLVYPVYSGQSFMDSPIDLPLTLNVGKHRISQTFTFQPYQSLLLKISPDGTLEELDINYVPNDPVVKPREKQKMYF